MGMVSLDRRIVAEVLDARGGAVLRTGSNRLQGLLCDVPSHFVSGAALAIRVRIEGEEHEALCRVCDLDAGTAIPCEPGAQIFLEVLRMVPGGSSPGRSSTDRVSTGAFDVFSLTLDSNPSFPLISSRGAPMAGGSAPPAAERFEEDEPTGVLGTLREMPLDEIVQNLMNSHRDALVEVKGRNRERGVLGVERGRVVFARTTSRQGEDAFFHLLTAQSGTFRIRYGRTVGDRNIERETTFLLLEGARVIDERRREGRPSGSTGSAGFLDKEFTSLAVPAMPTLPSLPSSVSLEENGAEAVQNVPGRVPAPVELGAEMGSASVVGAGPFARFFEEAGVSTDDRPMPQATRRFHSLRVDLGIEDAPDVDTERTLRERRHLLRASDVPA